MSIKDVAARLGISVATTYAIVAAGKLRCHRIGLGRGCIRISEEQVAEFLRGAAPVVRLAEPPPPVGTIQLKHLHR